MSKKIQVVFCLLFFISTGITCFSQQYDPGRRYSVQQLQSDFLFLRNKLERVNPGLYLYTSKEELDVFFDSLYNSITSPLTEREFYNTITLLNSKIKDGHTMFLPGEKATNYYISKQGFFPFYIIISGNRMYVNMNCSSDTLIKDGAELLSIDGTDTQHILEELTKRQTRDGNNETYPEWILTNYFKSYYSFSFGNSSSFIIGYKNADRELQTATIKALSNDSIRFYRTSKYAGRVDRKKGIMLEVDKRAATATLSIPSFNNDILKSEYNQHFRTEIEKNFKTIRDSSIRHLILDIRNNQGGDWEPGRLLLSYLILQPAKYLENSIQSRTITPAENNFTGNLYVLINGGNFSNAGIVSSCLEQAGRATFIGEEAAGNRTVINGEPSEYILPDTKIAIQVSTRNYIIRKGINNGHGVVPSHNIIPAVADIISGRDIVKEFVTGLILKNNN